MSRVAREVFSIPASQSTSERAFSVGSYVCAPRRGSLKPEKIEELITIKLNQSLIKDYMEDFEVPMLTKPKDAFVEYDMNPYAEEVIESDSEDDIEWLGAENPIIDLVD